VGALPQVIREDEDIVFNSTVDFARFDARFSSRSVRLERPVGPLLWALSAAVAGLVMFGCATPTATLDVSAPSSATIGLPFTITVTAMVNGRRDTIINTSIHFTSSDRAAVLPADYYFTAADAGSHNFTNGVTLMTAGSQSIRATVAVSPSIAGTANVTVSAANTATQFALACPSTSSAY
jgi:hypothetical protein